MPRRLCRIRCGAGGGAASRCRRAPARCLRPDPGRPRRQPDHAGRPPPRRGHAPLRRRGHRQPCPGHDHRGGGACWPDRCRSPRGRRRRPRHRPSPRRPRSPQTPLAAARAAGHRAADRQTGCLGVGAPAAAPLGAARPKCPVAGRSPAVAGMPPAGTAAGCAAAGGAVAGSTTGCGATAGGTHAEPDSAARPPAFAPAAHPEQAHPEQALPLCGQIRRPCRRSCRRSFLHSSPGRPGWPRLPVPCSGACAVRCQSRRRAP